MKSVLAASLVVAVCSAGCRSTWSQHDESLYTVMKAPSPATTLAHAKLVKRVIDNAESANVRPPAGLCAEYAFYLAKLGRLDEAKVYLDRESTYYPEAKTFLVAFERFLQGVTPIAGQVEAPVK